MSPVTSLTVNTCPTPNRVTIIKMFSCTFDLIFRNISTYLIIVSYRFLPFYHFIVIVAIFKCKYFTHYIYISVSFTYLFFWYLSIQLIYNMFTSAFSCHFNKQFDIICSISLSQPPRKKINNYTPEFQSSSDLTIIPELQMYFKKCLYNVTTNDTTKVWMKLLFS